MGYSGEAMLFSTILTQDGFGSTKPSSRARSSMNDNLQDGDGQWKVVDSGWFLWRLENQSMNVNLQDGWTVHPGLSIMQMQDC